MKTKLTLNSLIRTAVCAIALAAPALAHADSGTIKNNTKLTLSYKAGIADNRGYVSWQTFKLAPGQAHNWGSQGRPVAIMWDLTLGDGKFVPTRNNIPMSSRGYLSAFFRNGNQIWIDTSGGAR